MPELPDVAVYERYIQSTSLHQKIEHVKVTDRDVLRNVSRRKLASAAKGRQYVTTRRHGKHLFLQLSDGHQWFELHFGMTGRVKYHKSDDDQPAYSRMIVHFQNGYQLVYICQRKLGHVSLIHEPDKLIDELDLGPDALDQADDFGVFQKAIADRRGTVKSALMSQSRLAGLGNVYSDEILYHAHVHPRQAVRELTEKDLHVLHRSMLHVLKTAIQRHAEVDRMPRSWLLPHRTNGGRCPRCGGDLQTLKISGRTTHFCPQCQERG